MNKVLLVELAVAAYAIGWCAYIGVIVVRSWHGNDRALRFARPRRTRCARPSSFA